MNPPRFLTRVTGWILVVCFLGAGFLQPAPGQISTLKKVVEGKESEKPAEQEKVEDIRKRLETWYQEAREALNRIDAGGNSVTLPEGISTAEFEDRRRDLEQMVLVTTSAIKNLAALAEAAKAAETARAEEAAWTGFKEPPPYSVLMIDELLNERDAIKAQDHLQRVLAHQLRADPRHQPYRSQGS